MEAAAKGLVPQGGASIAQGKSDMAFLRSGYYDPWCKTNDAKPSVNICLELFPGSPVDALFDSFLALWTESFDGLASSRGRKLSALAMCRLLSLPSGVVLQRLGELIVCITGAGSVDRDRPEVKSPGGMVAYNHGWHLSMQEFGASQRAERMVRYAQSTGWSTAGQRGTTVSWR